MASPIGSAPPPTGTGPERPRRADDTGPERPRRADDTGPERPRRADDTASGGSSSVGSQAPKGTPVMLPDNWVAKVTDRIVTTVDGVRAKTTVPVEKIGRVVVWGLLIATAGLGLAIVLLVGLLRLAYELVGNIPGISGRPGRSVWMIDVLLGVVLIAVGLLLVKKGTKPTPED